MDLETAKKYLELGISKGGLTDFRELSMRYMDGSDATFFRSPQYTCSGPKRGNIDAINALISIYLQASKETHDKNEQ
jgi:hypothetical protein